MKIKIALLTLFVLVFPAIKASAEEMNDPFRTAISLYEEGNYSESLELVSQLLTDDDFGGLLLLPWILSTCPDDNIRDGERAMEYAVKLHCQMVIFIVWDLPRENPPRLLSNIWIPWAVLASTFAELGEYSRASSCQMVALLLSELIDTEVPHKKKLQERLQAILKLYQHELPLRTTKTNVLRISDTWLEAILNADNVKEIDFDVIDAKE